MKELKRFYVLLKKITYIMDKPHKVLGLFVIILTFIGSLFEMLGVSVILPLIQSMTNPETGERIRRITEKYGFTVLQQMDTMHIMVFGAVAVYLMKNIYLIYLSYLRAYYSADVQKGLAFKMNESYISRGYDFFRANSTPKLLQGTTEGVNAVNIVIYSILKILAELLTIVCIFVYVAYVDIQTITSMFVIVLFCMALTVTVFKRAIQNAGEQAHEQTFISGRWQLQLYEGIKEVLVMRRQNYFMENYKNAYSKRQKATVVQTFASEVPAYVIEAICVIGLLLSIGIRLKAVDNTVAYLPTLATLAMAAFRVLPSAGRITSLFNSILYQIPYVNDIYDNVIEADRIANRCLLEKREIDSNARKMESKEGVLFKNCLQISNIAYRYPDADEDVLAGISLKIRKGESIALVGASGAGKSTLADIVLGLLKPHSGGVYVDGENIYEICEKWANIVGYVPQKTYLIDDSIRRNVAFGIADEDIDDEMIWSVLDKAQMKKYVKSLPQSIDTIVGERGIRLSGGQIQRLAIARALYRNPYVLVLDEATSALDNDTESAVMDAIDALHGEKTLIVIAHRITTVRNCDRIYEIKNGTIVERAYLELLNSSD